MEANDAAELMEQEKTSDSSSSAAAIGSRILAMLLAITALGGNNATKEAVNSNVLASNYFNFFQAKNMRQTAIALCGGPARTGLVLNDPALSPDAVKAALKKKAEDYRKTIARYESEPETGEGKKELLRAGQGTRGDSATTRMKQDPYFDYAEALLQIAIVLISVVDHRRYRLAGCLGGALGVLGALLDGQRLFAAGERAVLGLIFGLLSGELLRARLFQNRHHLRVAAAFRERERRRAAAVRDVHVGAGFDQRAQRVGVVLAAVAEHDRLDQRGPAEIVDVVERRLRPRSACAPLRHGRDARRRSARCRHSGW